MPVSSSPRVIAAAIGVALALGSVALIQTYRGLAAPPGAGGMSSSNPPVQARKDGSRVDLPSGEGHPAAPAGGLLFAPPMTAARQSFSAARSADPVVPVGRSVFEPARPAAGATVLRSSDEPAVSRVAPAPPPAKRRDKVTRSASCDSKMPEDAWLDVCG